MRASDVEMIEKCKLLLMKRIVADGYLRWYRMDFKRGHRMSKCLGEID